MSKIDENYINWITFTIIPVWVCSVVGVQSCVLNGGIAFLNNHRIYSFTHCLNRKFCNSDLIDFSTLWVRIFNVTACLLPFSVLIDFQLICFFFFLLIPSLFHFISFSFLLWFFFYFSFSFSLLASYARDYITSIVHCLCHGHDVSSMLNNILYVACVWCVFFSFSHFDFHNFLCSMFNVFETIVEYKTTIDCHSNSFTHKSFIYKCESKSKWYLKRKCCCRFFVFVSKRMSWVRWYCVLSSWKIDQRHTIVLVYDEIERNT